MSIYQKLLNKGFERVKYSNQSEPNVWYRIEYTDELVCEKLIELLKECKGYWESSFENLRVSIEIREDLSYAQYLITEQKLDFGGDAHDELTIEEFEQLLDKLDDVTQRV
jgi:hypothetical protein